MQYAQFDNDGVLKTCLIEGIHAIPKSAIAIDNDLFLRLTQETDGYWMLGADGKITKSIKPPAAPNYPAMVAAERFRREKLGVVARGLLIDTTRDSQALIAGMAVAAMLDATYRCNFKTATDFVELDAPQILAISSAVRAHVQACFDREKLLLELVEKDAFSIEMLTEGWPNPG